MPINTDQVDDIRQAFELFIPDKQSTVRPVDMVATFEKIGLDQSKSAIYEMVKSMDTTYNNEMGMMFDDFMD